MIANGLETAVADQKTYDQAVKRFREARIALPTFEQLAEPDRIPAKVTAALAGVDPDSPHPLNLFRVHWWNDSSRRARAALPEHVVLPKSFTGVDTPIVVAFGDRFPMIHAHKVLAAYSCLAPRIVTGRYDPMTQRAVWPSTGNYCRGGVAISRIMECRGVAVLPEDMSAERFDWLDRWVLQPGDIIRTPGCESNVKEIYDECALLEKDPHNVILNQFSEYANHLGHYFVTGSALGAIFRSMHAKQPALRLAGFVSATGSAGTIGAGDYLKEHFGARIVAAEALECPTLLENGFGEHNIQGIGDKHVPLIHNVMNTDVVAAVSDQATDRLGVIFQTEIGRRFLARRHGVPADVLETLSSFGLSSICNVIAAIKTAEKLGLGPNDVIITVATDGDRMYGSEHVRTSARDFPGGVDEKVVERELEHWLYETRADHVLELTEQDRRRIFNLGYYTWVEQRGVTIEHFTARADQKFWKGLHSVMPQWNAMIDEFNVRTGALESL
ncbi:MAG: pyridoxal-5'-phosphate-dependent protein subunit beta [Candidatus Eisenbacteria bacterium]|nr:pyridoxal-5'-phosphate-dependent protein subunit beta [Candidatus Eisenbacteria bacterium]